MRKILMKLDDFVSDLNEVNDVMFWVECPRYQDEITDVTAENLEDNNGRLVKHITFKFDGFNELDSSVEEDIYEYSKLVYELSQKEIELIKIKAEYDEKKFNIKYIEDIDFKKLYGKANDDTRKHHVEIVLKELIDKKNDLEIDIDYLKRRIRFLQSLINTKTYLKEVNKDG